MNFHVYYGDDTAASIARICNRRKSVSLKLSEDAKPMLRPRVVGSLKNLLPSSLHEDAS